MLSFDCLEARLLLHAEIDGVWQGTTEQGRPMSFEVSDHGLLSISVQMRIEGTRCSSTVTQSTENAQSRVNDDHAFEVELIGSDTSLLLMGEFITDSRATGTLIMVDAFCEGVLQIEWSATLPVLGDFTLDGTVSADDVDVLFAAVKSGSSDPSFDLTEDGVVGNSDLDLLVMDVLGTSFGDANLDGTVAFEDFIILATGFGKSGGWGQGDFDGDGQIAFSDFSILAEHFGAGT